MSISPFPSIKLLPLWSSRVIEVCELKHLNCCCCCCCFMLWTAATLCVRNSNLSASQNIDQFGEKLATRSRLSIDVWYIYLHFTIQHQPIVWYYSLYMNGWFLWVHISGKYTIPVPWESRRWEWKWETFPPFRRVPDFPSFLVGALGSWKMTTWKAKDTPIFKAIPVVAGFRGF